jgi:hypothetical protein
MEIEHGSIDAIIADYGELVNVHIRAGTGWARARVKR